MVWPHDILSTSCGRSGYTLNEPCHVPGKRLLWNITYPLKQECSQQRIYGIVQRGKEWNGMERRGEEAMPTRQNNPLPKNTNETLPTPGCVIISHHNTSHHITSHMTHLGLPIDTDGGGISPGFWENAEVFPDIHWIEATDQSKAKP